MKVAKAVLRQFLGGLIVLVSMLVALELAQAATFTVNSTDDAGDSSPGDGMCATGGGVCTLRAAIEEANALAGSDTIDFSVTGVIMVGTSLTIDPANGSDSLTVSGPGPASLAVDGGGTAQVFVVGSVFAGATVEISGLTIQNGSAANGGGLVNFSMDGTTVLTNVALSGNAATTGGIGGAIANFLGTLALTNVTVNDNSADFGGGVFNNTGNTMTLTNVTLSNNSVRVAGGGIYNVGTMTLTNVTISGNSATWDGAGGGIFNFGTLTLQSTIVANSTGSDCPVLFAGGAPTSLGYNLDSDGSCALDPGLGDLPATDPLLAPLADNGGPTRTHALCTAVGEPDASCTGPSPAIDTGSPDCPPPDTDQRGVSRAQDGNGDGVAACDIGAYEVSVQKIVVTIDIRPFSSRNSVFPRSPWSVLSVAVLATADFDVKAVDAASVRFGPSGAAPIQVAFRDVNGDRVPDMVLFFRTSHTGIQCGDASASLTGQTVNAAAFEGSDSVNTVGCKSQHSLHKKHVKHVKHLKHVKHVKYAKHVRHFD